MLSRWSFALIMRKLTCWVEGPRCSSGPLREDEDDETGPSYVGEAPGCRAARRWLAGRVGEPGARLSFVFPIL